MQLLLGDCLDKLKELPDNLVDSIVTDPPYGLSNHSVDDTIECLTAWLAGESFGKDKKGFMGKSWDGWVPSPDVWRECYRVLKHGGYAAVFAGTRTMDLMGISLRLAGFEYRDTVMYLYGSGFPKSLNIGAAVDKLQGNEREEIGLGKYANRQPNGLQGANITNFKDSIGKKYGSNGIETKGNSPWEGYGTALKPAFEPILLFRKPLEGTVAQNVLKYGTGGLNIDGCRIPTDSVHDDPRLGGKGEWHIKREQSQDTVSLPPTTMGSSSKGRFPANIIHDGSEEVLEHFPNTKSGILASHHKRSGDSMMGAFAIRDRTGEPINTFGDSGSAARFFYTAKADKSDREEGLDDFEEKRHADRNKTDGVGGNNPRNRTNNERKNIHPTVKPVDLMQYICRLVTPAKGTVLDPFMGSGSTGKAAMLELFDFIGIEREPEYYEIAKTRIKFQKKNRQPTLLDDL